MFKSFTFPIHASVAGFSLVLQQLCLRWVNYSYVRSAHPVDYATGQTSFDAGLVKGWYGSMQDGGTLGVYVQTQVIDFAFIAATILFGLAFGSFVRRIAVDHSIAAWGGVLAMVCIPLAAGFDAVENMISFAMLANPLSFADWIVYPYSAAATVKFVLMGIGFTAIAASLVINLPERWVRARRNHRHMA